MPTKQQWKSQAKAHEPAKPVKASHPYTIIERADGRWEIHSGNDKHVGRDVSFASHDEARAMLQRIIARGPEGLKVCYYDAQGNQVEDKPDVEEA